ncbi:F-box/kelch-repeat protein-like [Dorcoceras hygrometricum]|uniref:F-box/kelch-repeat protein-like n=1 Tax=Dorcoceras hygrometricum TaxID=472368 RepID=A0A2Z7C8R4_9LAMI|nr:F-box/kelch-repeat protein-like [Dorcoceras hygrometricum]
MDTVSFDYASDDPDEEIRIVGSCNGLICTVLYPFSVVLWNPATRKYKELPDSSGDNFSRSYGFGYDVFNEDYKVSCIDLNPAPNPVQVRIYSLRNDLWTTSEWSHGEVFDNPGVFVHGAIHWKVYSDGYSGSDWDILAQDLTTGKCSTVALPVPRIASGSEIMLGVSGRFLCVFHDHGSYMNIWMLKEYGVKESWNIMVSFPYFFRTLHPDYIRLKLLFVSENGGILMRLGSNMIMYKPSQYHEIYPVIDNIDVEATTYIESFVSPDFEHMWS